MTDTADTHGVVVVGGCLATELRDAGITDFVVLDREITSSVFDGDSDAWTLTTRGGDTCRGRVVITGESPFVPWIPDLAGHNDFRGESFHAAAPDPDFGPADQRIVVIGSDSTAGSFIERVSTSAASVTVFPHPPRRVMLTARRRWRRRRASPQVVTSPIDAVTASGIRTCDGARYHADAIVYGTGSAIAHRNEALVGVGGVTLQQAWYDGMEPYLGIALHGFPNYFLATEPDTVRYITNCLRLVDGHSRIEVRRSSQQVFNERVHLRRPRRGPVASAFDLSSSSTAHDDIYDGAATLTVGDTRRQVRARLTGHVDPIDGQYHWQGTIFGHLPIEVVKQAGAVTLAVGERNAPGRITEQTPQGTHSIGGVGAPPFALGDIELTVPARGRRTTG